MPCGVQFHAGGIVSTVQYVEVCEMPCGVQFHAGGIVSTVAVF